MTEQLPNNSKILALSAKISQERLSRRASGVILSGPEEAQISIQQWTHVTFFSLAHLHAHFSQGTTANSHLIGLTEQRRECMLVNMTTRLPLPQHLMRLLLHYYLLGQMHLK